MPFPFLGDFTGDSDVFNPGGAGQDASSGPDATGVPPFLLQALQSLAGPGAAFATNAHANHTPQSSDPLMIEFQNGHYVRVKSNAIDGEAQPVALPAAANSHSAKAEANLSSRKANGENAAAAPAHTTLASAAATPPAILLFRDGHSEQVRDYTIANGVLYANGDYYNDGYWNKKIELAALDLPATLQANAARNVKFTLPASPNEVIARF